MEWDVPGVAVLVQYGFGGFYPYESALLWNGIASHSEILAKQVILPWHLDQRVLKQTRRIAPPFFVFFFRMITKPKLVLFWLRGRFWVVAVVIVVVKVKERG
jgi:hypothetical protein